MLFAQEAFGSPPVEGMNGWLLGLAITCVATIAGNIWSEYQRRTERRDKKDTERSLAEVQSDQARTQLEFESVKNVIEMQRQDGIAMRAECAALRDECSKLREAYQKAMLEVAARDVIIHERDITIADMQRKISELERKVTKLEGEVTQIESREQGRQP